MPGRKGRTLDGEVSNEIWYCMLLDEVSAPEDICRCMHVCACVRVRAGRVRWHRRVAGEACGLGLGPEWENRDLIRHRPERGVGCALPPARVQTPGYHFWRPALEREHDRIGWPILLWSISEES